MSENFPKAEQSEKSKYEELDPRFAFYVHWLDSEIQNHVASHNYRGTVAWSAVAAYFAVLVVANGVKEFPLAQAHPCWLRISLVLLLCTALVFVRAQYWALSIAADRASEFRRAKTKLLASGKLDPLLVELGTGDSLRTGAQWPKLFEAPPLLGFSLKSMKCQRKLSAFPRRTWKWLWHHRGLSELASHAAMLIVTFLAYLAVQSQRETHDCRTSQNPCCLQNSTTDIGSAIAAGGQPTHSPNFGLATQSPRLAGSSHLGDAGDQLLMSLNPPGPSCTGSSHLGDAGDQLRVE